MSSWIKRGMVSFALATAKMEEQALKQSDEGLGTGDGVINPYHKNQLMSDLKEGRITQEVKEFREHHYKVLRSAEKFKVKWGNSGEVEVLSESEIKELKNAKGDPYDSYPVEVTVNNAALSKGVYETTQVRPIKVQRGVVPRTRIEEHSDLVLIRDIDGKNKLVEFYIPNTIQNRSVLAEISNISSNPRVTDFVNITKLYFTTPGGEPLNFEYKMLAFDKVVEHNGNYIVKMFAECTQNGIWAAQKFMLND
jgi:hypothetical protein